MTDIRQWLDAIGLGQYGDAFEENAIEREQLPDLDHEVLQAIGVKAAGHRIKILKTAANIDVDAVAGIAAESKSWPTAWSACGH